MASCSLGNGDVLDSGHALRGGRMPLQHNNSGNPVYLTGAKFLPSTVVIRLGATTTIAWKKQDAVHANVQKHMKTGASLAQLPGKNGTRRMPMCENT